MKLQESSTLDIYKKNIINALLKNKLEYLITVPTSGMNEIYEHFITQGKCICVTREEEGVAIASGLTLGNKKAFMFIQQSGVGNLLNAIFTLADPYDIFFPIIVMIRGKDDPNPIHWESSEKTINILKGLGHFFIDWNKEICNEDLKECIDNRIRWILAKY